MRRRSIAAAGALALLGVGGGTAGVASSADTSPTSGCDHRWHAHGMNIEGVPADFASGIDAGTYIWHDCQGWHLRTTDPIHEPGTYSGMVTLANGSFTSLQLYERESDDHLAPTGTSFAYHFTTYWHQDGVDFTTTATSLTFTILQSPFRHKNIHCGPQGRSPGSSTFTVSVSGNSTDQTDAAAVATTGTASASAGSATTSSGAGTTASSASTAAAAPAGPWRVHLRR